MPMYISPPSTPISPRDTDLLDDEGNEGERVIERLEAMTLRVMELTSEGQRALAMEMPIMTSDGWVDMREGDAKA
jgi:hypothetical protein